MLLEQQKQLISLIQAAVAQCLPEAQAQVQLERPKVAAHGDIATNVAMQLAKPARRNPRELAQGIVDALMAQPQARELIQDAEIAGPGFINFRLTPAARQAVVQAVASQADAYGRAPRNGEKVLVEFVSANPTGPLHVGHARQAALGDAICRLYDASSGWDVTREFYYNDAGNQIDNLAISVQARGRGIAPDAPDYPADGYKGDYIVEIARDFAARKSVQASDGQPVTATGDLDSLDDIRAFAVAYLRREQDLDLQAFGLAFDNYFLESSLYASGRVQETVDTLVAKGHTYEEGGALWLRTTELGTGDDKDRVMRKSEGGYTYFVPDVAYHKVKWERGFHHAVNIQGSDHHGTVARVRAGLQGLAGIPKDFPAYVLHKMVKVMRGGEEVKISKRAGSYVTMRDLIDWVGRDAVRYFLIQRRADTEFVFDIDLALSKSDENPVYYIQYAHARICTMIGNSGASAAEIAQADTALLTAPSEYALLQRLAEFPQVVALAAQELAPHHVAFWLRDCASDFHAWYNAERVLVDEPALKLARLRLAATTRQVLANGLALLGVSAPDRM
ncbi:arginine--tRNA ligase [Bordetella pertussis]